MLAWETLALAELSQPLSFQPLRPNKATQASWDAGRIPSLRAMPGICAASFMHAASSLEAGACNGELEESAACRGSLIEEMAPGWILKRMQRLSEVRKCLEKAPCTTTSHREQRGTDGTRQEGVCPAQVTLGLF